MMKHQLIYPFSALVGQEKLKQVLMIGAVNPAVGGILIRGEKGTAKSTAVRALAALLPGIKTIHNCAFMCDPDDPAHFCPACVKNKDRLKIKEQRVRVVDLPLNATEDRVSGGIDFTGTIQSGMRLLSPGILASAHRGILYVDEVNLLDDHIVDIILDAAASGENRLEREGISYSHPSRFMLVGTMNPEEGELRPQLLDRFGLSIKVEGEQDPEKRVRLMTLREEFDNDKPAFIQKYQVESAATAEKIADGVRQLPKVRISRHLKTFIAELCMENFVAGHRADLFMEQAARALAALEMKTEVDIDHIREVAPMVLDHRRRDAAPPPPPPPPEHDEHQQDDEEEPPEEDQEQPENEEQPPEEEQDQEQQQPEEMEAQPPDTDAESSEQENPEDGEQPQSPESNQDVGERIFEIGATFKVKPISTPKDKVFRRGSGRRSRTRISQKQGRYVKSTFGCDNGDIALDATLRAAAPYQKHRKNGNSLAVVLKDQDMRGKIREKRIGNFLLFAVDASGSMGSRGRMAASKGAIMSLLLDAYQKRDKVAMLSFRRNEAVVNLPPTTSVDLAGKLLSEMPVGGRTPLSAGLSKIHEMVRNALLKDPSVRPIVLLITDGKSNVSFTDQKPLEESMYMGEALACDDRVQYIVVDTEEQGLVTFGLAAKLAAAMNAEYYKIEDLKAESLVDLVKNRDV